MVFIGQPKFLPNYWQLLEIEKTSHHKPRNKTRHDRSGHKASVYLGHYCTICIHLSIVPPLNTYTYTKPPVKPNPPLSSFSLKPQNFSYASGSLLIVVLFYSKFGHIQLHCGQFNTV